MNVIVTSSTDDYYLDYWPYFKKSWEKQLGFPIYLAVVTDRQINIPDSVRIKPVEGIPLRNQGKLARFFLASMLEDKICTISDIDIWPLQNSMLKECLSKRSPGQLLTIGKNVYDRTEFRGRFGIQYMTVEGRIFRDIFNPQGLKEDQWYQEQKSFEEFDRESVTHPRFSDELLWRILIRKWKGTVIHLDRPYRFSVGSIEKGPNQNSNNHRVEDLYRGKIVHLHAIVHNVPEYVKDYIDAPDCRTPVLQ